MTNRVMSSSWPSTNASGSLFALNLRARELLIIVIMANVRWQCYSFILPSSFIDLRIFVQHKREDHYTNDDGVTKIISLTTTAQPIVTTIAQRKSNLFTLWETLSFDRCEDSLVVRANTNWQHIELNCSSARFLNSNPPHCFLTWWTLSGSDFNWHWVCHKTSMFCRSQSTLSTSILNTNVIHVVECW